MSVSICPWCGKQRDAAVAVPFHCYEESQAAEHEKRLATALESAELPTSFTYRRAADAGFRLAAIGPLDIEAGVRAVEAELVEQRDENGRVYWIVDKRDIGRALRTWAREQQGGA